jgi:phenylpyruvate tautomerase PptA (4-oxalocrotonate tautomerase family)
MPYLRITCPEISSEQKRTVAKELTDEINTLFYNPKGGPSREELRSHTTVHFMPYQNDEVYIGGQTTQERGGTDLTVELSDWNMNVKQQKKVAQGLTPILAKLFSVKDLENVNIRFHSYPPTDFSVGGKLISELVPRIGQVMKRIG